jgi:hypothetical protein
MAVNRMQVEHVVRGLAQFEVARMRITEAGRQVARTGYETWAEEAGARVAGTSGPTDGNLVRSQVTAAIGAVNAQLRADEQQLRRKRTGDVFERLLKIIEKQKKALAVPQQQVEQVELERSDAEASVMAADGDGSEGG